MLNRMKTMLCLSLIAAAILCPLGAMAQTAVYPAHINEVTNGWGSDTIGVSTDEPVVNPANCQLHDYYLSEASDPGNRSYYAAALTALANKLTVTIVVSNTACTTAYPSRPKIIAVSPSRP